NGRSSESHQACLNGRVVTDEGEAKSPQQQCFCPFRAKVTFAACTQGVALGYVLVAPLGRTSS
ncbi:MAG: hypothetical protein K6B45_02015, partial [Bacteroidaceae bacterium]|nr:hypothetical protein [Bacteroidaceae bacterium]